MKIFENIKDMISHAKSNGLIQSDTASWLNGLCQYGSPAIAAAYLQKVQPYTVNEKLNRYELK